MSVFDAYKGIHSGETAILVGTGPSIKEFDVSTFAGAMLIGSNEAVYLPYKMDYYFIGDAGTTSRGYLSDPESYSNYEPVRRKFVRIKTSGSYAAMPSGIRHALYYKTNMPTYGGAEPVLNLDLSKGPNDAGSISFEMLQFALWCGFSRIILVGQDCSYAQGSFKTAEVGDATSRWGEVIFASWGRVAKFVREFCPEVEVISYRPVRLDMFPEVKPGESA